MRCRTVFIVISVLILSACASQNYTVKTRNLSAANLRFQRTIVTKNTSGVHIAGRLAANRIYGLPKGHIDIAAYSSSGDLLAEITHVYISSLLTNRVRKKGGVRYQADLRGDFPFGSLFKIAFHSASGQPADCLH